MAETGAGTRLNDPSQSKSEESEVSSATGDTTVGGSIVSPQKNPFQGVKPARFNPSMHGVAGMNPFAERPSLKSDAVSSSNTGTSNPAKFILRPSALSVHPPNAKNDNSPVNPSAVTSILKPAKLPDPTRPNTKDQGGGEKENTEVTSLNSDEAECEPEPDVTADSTAPTSTTDQSETDRDAPDDNIFQSAIKAFTEKKVPDSSTSGTSSSESCQSQTQASFADADAEAAAEAESILGQNLTEKVTGVHTSPKGHVRSSGFVFGENLADRVQFTEEPKGDKSEDNGVASPDSTEQSGEGTKTLEESAREYQASHEKRTELQEVEVVTGEEDESNVMQVNVKLFVFDGETQNWVERGRGLLRLNDMRCQSSQTFQSRLLMRTQGSLRVILNTKIWPGMTVEKASRKSVRITGTDGDGVKVFLIMTNPKDSENLHRALDWRVQQLRVQEEQTKDSGAAKGGMAPSAEKRKAEPESPPEDFSIKKTKKSEDDVINSYRREESDSSVVDPETEVSSESHASSFTLRTDSD